LRIAQQALARGDLREVLHRKVMPSGGSRPTAFKFTPPSPINPATSHPAHRVSGTSRFRIFRWSRCRLQARGV
jgi:hypothetical protein